MLFFKNVFLKLKMAFHMFLKQLTGYFWAPLISLSVSTLVLSQGGMMFSDVCVVLKYFSIDPSYKVVNDLH